MPRPRDIRKVIAGNVEDLRGHDLLRVRRAASSAGHGGVRGEVDEYWLTEAQAIRVLSLLKTEFAIEQTRTVIQAFGVIQVLRNRATPSPTPAP